MENADSYIKTFEFDYNGHWIEVTVRHPDGSPDLFIADIRISGQSPQAPARHWASFDGGDKPAFADPETASEDASNAAKAYVDRSVGKAE